MLSGSHANTEGIVAPNTHCTARTRDIGQQFAEIREAAGITAYALAAQMGVSVPTLSKFERGLLGMSITNVIHYLACCGVKAPEAKHYSVMASIPETGYHVASLHGRIADELLPLIVHEATMESINQFDCLYVPGLLQARDYTSALLHEGVESEDAIEHFAQVRMDRQLVLARYDPPMSNFFISEHVLRTMVGGPQIMNDQLMKLHFASDWPNCSVRVVPANKLASSGVTEPFRLMTFASHGPVVTHDLLNATVFVDKEADLALYREALERLDHVALSGGPSKALIAKLADQYGRMGAGQDELGATGDDLA